jgi:hypothetical protein
MKTICCVSVAQDAYSAKIVKLVSEQGESCETNLGKVVPNLNLDVSITISTAAKLNRAARIALVRVRS